MTWPVQSQQSDDACIDCDRPEIGCVCEDQPRCSCGVPILMCPCKYRGGESTRHDPDTPGGPREDEGFE